MLATDPWIQTHTGRRFRLLHPDPADIEPVDIAHALSQLCRFGGHTYRFCSVGAHSLLVAALVPPHLSASALLHDATEAYLVDLPKPLKSLLPAYSVIEQSTALAISARFSRLGAPIQFDHPAIHEADRLALVTEAHYLLGPKPDSWGPEFDGIDPLPIAHPALRALELSPAQVKAELMQGMTAILNAA
jgi:hypothetical protein